MIKVGCCGFPVARETYFGRLGLVEINSTFYNCPGLETAARWRSEAPSGFEFTLKAWQLITHPSSSPTYEKLRKRPPAKSLARCGLFQATPEVLEAWSKTSALAEVLRPAFILFQTPAAFYPNANTLRDMYRFFKGISRGPALLAWEPRGESWDDALVRRVCGDLGLVHAVDPFSRESQRGPVRYWRLHGRLERGRVRFDRDFSPAELDSLRAQAAGAPAYVLFNNSGMWRDAQAFAGLLEPRPSFRARSPANF